MKRIPLLALLLAAAGAVGAQPSTPAAKLEPRPGMVGDFEVYTAFASKFLPPARNLIVFLPPGYREGNRRYPVLYMHDGQNLFDPATGFAGQEWHLDEVASQLIAAGKIPPLIIVGIYNTSGRMQEYTSGMGDKQSLYARLVVEEVMPFIDAHYRTLQGPENTGLGGSSLGALVSVAMGLKYPQVFGKLVVMSPSVFWDSKVILKAVSQFEGKARPKVWLDIGTKEGSNPVSTLENTRELRDALAAKGWKLGADLRHVEAEGAEHNERAWSQRIGPAIEFLFGQDNVKSISPPGAQIVGPYTPGLLAGRFLYVSGQGAKDSKGETPRTAAGQLRQTLDNVKSIVEAAGLTMEHVVYSQLYVTDAAAYDEVLAAWGEYFKDGGPARGVMGVARMPGDTPVEVNAVAVTDLRLKRVVRVAGAGRTGNTPDAVVAGDKLFFSNCYGLDASGKVPADSSAQTQLALDRMGVVLKAAGVAYDNVVFVNPYRTDSLRGGDMDRVYAKYFKFGDTPARATINVAHLPLGANIAFTGVAAMNLADRRSVRPKNMPPSATASPCVFAGDTLYCSAKSAFIPGPNQGIYASTVEHQVRQSVRNLLDGLEEAGVDLSNVVSTNVYLDDIQEFAKMNGIYATYFKTPPPTRTTVQQRASAERKPSEGDRWPTLEQISLVAVK
jgi:enamine deaminase RidA (YjgF/YER057c/UK114 family)